MIFPLPEEPTQSILELLAKNAEMKRPTKRL